MTCNVCAELKRCFTLSEMEGGPPPFTRYGMKFYICSDCLLKLIASIKTDKTVLEKPDDFPIPEHVKERMGHFNSMRERK